MSYSVLEFPKQSISFWFPGSSPEKHQLYLS